MKNKKKNGCLAVRIAQELGFKTVKDAIRAGYHEAFEDIVRVENKPHFPGYETFESYWSADITTLGYMQGRGASY